MKKIIVLVAMMMVLLTGCGQEVRSEFDEDSESMFVIVEETPSWRIVYHAGTKVMYAVSYGGYNSGNFTLLVNPDGSPMVWMEE